MRTPSAITTLLSLTQRESITLFQPFLQLKVPSVTHFEPLFCWLTLTVPSLAPSASKITKGAEVERSPAAGHQASIVRVWSEGR